MDLFKLTLDQLKALCYDQLVILNQAQANINILQAEINKRQPQAEVQQAEQPKEEQ